MAQGEDARELGEGYAHNGRGRRPPQAREGEMEKSMGKMERERASIKQ